MEGPYYNGAQSHQYLLLYMQVDKEFVWSLWKETQQELPNVSEIIEMVVAR